MPGPVINGDGVLEASIKFFVGGGGQLVITMPYRPTFTMQDVMGWDHGMLLFNQEVIPKGFSCRVHFDVEVLHASEREPLGLLLVAFHMDREPCGGAIIEERP